MEEKNKKVYARYLRNPNGGLSVMGIWEDSEGNWATEFIITPEDPILEKQTLTPVVIRGSLLLTKEKVKEFMNILVDDARMDLSEDEE